MLHRSHSLVSLALFAALAVPACGGESPAVPTTPHARGTETLSGPIPAHASLCKEFDNAKAGAVSAWVSPRSIYLVLGAGTCSAPGQILAEKDGEVTNVDAPAGRNHVRLSNRSDLDTSFTLSIMHWY